MNNPSESVAARLLREGRESAELEIDAASVATRIPMEQIKALEEGRFNELPGAAYARAFSRTLAMAYGIDPDEVVAAVRRDMNDPAEESISKRNPPQLAQMKSPSGPPEPSSNRKSRGPLLLVGALVVLLLSLIGLTRLKGDTIDTATQGQFPSPLADSIATDPASKTDSLADTVVLPPRRTVSFALVDSSKNAFILYIKANRVRRWTLHGLDSLEIDPDTVALFRNLSGNALRMSGAQDRDSLALSYFRLGRKSDSTVYLEEAAEEDWRKSYDALMAKKTTRKKETR